MRNRGALAFATAGSTQPALARDVPQNALAGLFKPLPFLLASGGDARLAIDRASKANAYGCRTSPTPQTLAFSSSTATSISERAYASAHQAREELIASSIDHGIIDAFDARCEAMRELLQAYLKINADIAFSPSGTDSQLHVLFLLRELLGGPVATIIVGADQTGSGTAHTAHGRHFSDRTALGMNVAKGTPIAGHDIASIGISLFAEDGAVRTDAEIDAAIIEAIAQQIAMGRKIILQTMDSSKLGWRAPSDACLREISARWPQDVRTAVDACQMRISRTRLKEYLDCGYVVLMTGSKFFSGPAFSGASLWPQPLSARIAVMDAPRGLADYATRFDLPLHWTRIRDALPASPNFGQWLRWEAALEEMRAYYEIPESFRRAALSRLCDAAAQAIAASPFLELLPARADASDMPETIFPFFVKNGGGSEEMTKLYRALNRDLSDLLPGAGALASVRCHIGQPVQLACGTVLRIGIGARNISETWSDDAHTAGDNLRATIGNIGTVVKKIELVLATNAHLESLT